MILYGLGSLDSLQRKWTGHSLIYILNVLCSYLDRVYVIYFFVSLGNSTDIYFLIILIISSVKIEIARQHFEIAFSIAHGLQ